MTSIENRSEQRKGETGAYSGSSGRQSRASEDRRLLERYHHDDDPAAREALVERFLPLARQLARRYQRAGEPLDDLIQVASLGLLKAIERFDPARETAFSSFAVPTILGELKRHFRDKGWSVRVPRDLQELAVKVDRVGEDMGRELGRAPTPGEIAERIGATQEQVLEAREAAGAYRAVSLDRPRNEEDEEGELVDAFGTEDHGFELAEDAATVQRLMRVLSDREREVLRLRFEEDLTQSEIGDIVGVSQMHVSRLIRQSIARLRDGGRGAVGSAPVEHWDLTGLDVEPRQPQILDSKRGESRTIALKLAAGEGLAEHQVHERAHVIVIEGEVEIGDVTGGARAAGDLRPGRAPRGARHDRRPPAARARPVAGRRPPRRRATPDVSSPAACRGAASAASACASCPSAPSAAAPAPRRTTRACAGACSGRRRPACRRRSRSRRARSGRRR